MILIGFGDGCVLGFRLLMQINAVKELLQVFLFV